ncbi:unnamed protein product [Laminaria digitata]
MRLRCCRLGRAGLQGCANLWRKKRPRERKAVDRRGYLERKLAVVGPRPEARDQKAADNVSSISKGVQAQLLEPQEKPPIASDEATTEDSTSNAGDIIGAKPSAEAMYRASTSAVKANTARESAEADRGLLDAAQATYSVLYAGAKPYFSEQGTHPVVPKATDARAEDNKAEMNAVRSAAVALGATGKRPKGSSPFRCLRRRIQRSPVQPPSSFAGRH